MLEWSEGINLILKITADLLSSINLWATCGANYISLDDDNDDDFSLLHLKIVESRDVEQSTRNTSQSLNVFVMS